MEQGLSIETATDLAAINETTGNSQRHTTLDEILDNVRAALDEYADDHDIYALADKAYAWYRAYDPQANAEHLHEQGYYQAVTVDEFWAIAEAHAL